MALLRGHLLSCITPWASFRHMLDWSVSYPHYLSQLLGFSYSPMARELVLLPPPITLVLWVSLVGCFHPLLSYNSFLTSITFTPNWPMWWLNMVRHQPGTQSRERKLPRNVQPLERDSQHCPTVQGGQDQGGGGTGISHALGIFFSATGPFLLNAVCFSHVLCSLWDCVVESQAVGPM